MFKRMLMLGVIGFMAMGMPSWACGGGIDNNTKQSDTKQKEYLHLKTENALDLVSLLDKDLKTLDIPPAAIEYIGSSPFLVYYDTNFLEVPCMSATIGFHHDFATKADYVKDISLCIKEPNLKQCKDFLDKELGQCHSCGTLPYVAINGGAVTYFTYYKDGLKYHLSMGSARNYYTLQISKGEPKGAPDRQYTGLYDPSDNSMGMGMGMGMASEPIPNFSTPTSKPVATSATQENWYCPECGQANKGKFCGECGKPRPK